MIKKIGDVLGNRLLFICVLTVTLLFDTILLVHNYSGPMIKLFLVWGGFVIFLDFLHGRKLWHTKQLKWLILFCMAYLVTTVLTDWGYLSSNIKTLAYMLLFFIILYGHDRDQSMDSWKSEVRTVMTVFVITTAFLSAICMVTYIFQINIELLTVDGYMHFGMADNRLWGLYNPNIGGCINYLSILFSLGILLTLEKRKHYKTVLFILNMVLQYMCLLLTSSRTSLYTLVLCLGGFAFLSFNAKVKSLSLKTVKGFALNVLVTVLIMGGVYAVSDPVKNVLAYIPAYVDSDLTERILEAVEEAHLENIGKNTTNSESEDKDKIELTRLEVLENRDGGMLTGRLYIWEAGLKAWSRAPIFGISKNTIYDYSKEYIEDKQWLIPLETSLHNGYVTVLVASGIVGALIFVLFLMLNMIPMIKTAFTRAAADNYILYAMCLAVTISFLMVECFEARILYRTEIFTAVFWIICGFAYNYVEITNNVNKIEASENKGDSDE